MNSKKIQLLILITVAAIFTIAIFVFTKNVFKLTTKKPNITEISAKNLEKPKPYPKEEKNELNITAAAALSVFIKQNQEYFLFEKNKEVKLPIASITKLMVALLASEMYKSNDEIIISKTALSVKGNSGLYELGDKILLKDALYALLISSHNEIAVAIAEKGGISDFIEKMNSKAKELNLTDTRYFNVSGVDPEENEKINYSTALDTYKLLKHIFENYPNIFSILQEKEYHLKDARGQFKSIIKNTNKLLYENDAVLAFPVLGGKTGSTPRAKTNLAIVSKVPTGGYILSVVIGSEDNFQDMKNLLKYVEKSFVW